MKVSSVIGRYYSNMQIKVILAKDLNDGKAVMVAGVGYSLPWVQAIAACTVFREFKNTIKVIQYLSTC